MSRYSGPAQHLCRTAWASPYFGARWRFSDSFDARFEYFGWSDAGSGSAQGDIEFGDIRIPAGALSSADFKADIYALSLGWTFLKSERAELGVGLGLHVADTKASVSGSGFIGDTGLETVSESASVTAPLPNLRLFGTYAFTPNLAFEASLGYFSLSYDKYDGQLFTATAAMEYRFSKNFGIGVGYSFLNVDVDVDVDEMHSNDNWNFNLDGPTVFLSAGF